MNVWEFRRLVRERWFLLQDDHCPLGAAMRPAHDGRPAYYRSNPMPRTAEEGLGLPYGYVLGVIVGFAWQVAGAAQNLQCLGLMHVIQS